MKEEGENAQPVRSACRIAAALCACIIIGGASDLRAAAIACGDGRVDAILDDFDTIDSSNGWKICCTADPSIPQKPLHIVTGCHGNALAVDYDLTHTAPSDGPSWIVI